MDLLSMNKKAHPRPIKITFVLSEPGRARTHKRRKGTRHRNGTLTCARVDEKGARKKGKSRCEISIVMAVDTIQRVTKHDTMCTPNTYTYGYLRGLSGESGKWPRQQIILQFNQSPGGFPRTCAKL